MGKFWEGVREILPFPVQNLMIYKFLPLPTIYSISWCGRMMFLQYLLLVIELVVLRVSHSLWMHRPHFFQCHPYTPEILEPRPYDCRWIIRRSLYCYWHTVGEILVSLSIVLCNNKITVYWNSIPNLWFINHWKIFNHNKIIPPLPFVFRYFDWHCHLLTTFIL